MKRGTGRVIKAQPRPVRPVPSTNTSQKPTSAARKPSPLHPEPLPRTPMKKATAMRKPPLKPIPVSSQSSQARQMERRASPAPPRREVRPPPPRKEPQQLPPLGDMPAPGTPKFHNEWMRRVKICKKLQPFENVMEEGPVIERKHTALAQILSVIAEDDNCFKKITDEELDSLMEMVDINIFRPRPHLAATELFYEVPAGMYEKAWFHLEIVYLLLVRVHSLLPNNKHFDEKFVESMFGLFSVGFVTERMEVINFMKEYYKQHLDQRKFMRRKLIAILERHLMTHDDPFSTATCLPLFLTMCEVEEEDIESLYKLIEQYFLPLITDTYAFFYGVGLDMVIDFYTANEPDHAEKVVAQVVKYWPRQNTTKMSIYTGILVDYLPRMYTDVQDAYVPRVFPLFAENCTAPSPRLAEASFQIFLSPDFDGIMWRNCDTIIRIMVPSVVRCMTEHWETSIRDIARLCMSIMEKFNPELVQKVSSETMTEEENPKVEELDSWQAVIDMAKKNDSSIHGHRIMDKAKIAYKPRPHCCPCEVHDGTINAT